jgi:predicted nucleic acid-binding Zn ribbon protein
MKNELECSVCGSPMEDDEGIVGEFGILPVQFCVWCSASMTDMVIQMEGFDDIEMLEERIQYLKED